ncbi:hypothetical protein HY479_02845 [Candidatus Uhrbacteria bacterium]|nr:hypothetical protein [Candidatus Uhrbacteria bacterium]
MKRRKRPPRYMVSRRPHVTPVHCFFWAWHHIALAFLFCAFGGIAIGAFLLPASPASPAFASMAENVRGWAWADPVGWISLNDVNAGSGGGTYGAHVDFSTGELNGFGWSENAGWICFGDSCSTPSCSGSVPPSNLPYNVPFAAVTPAPYAPGGTIRNAHGWAKVCNLGDAGWISLNCSDPIPNACGAYSYRVPFDMSTHQFQDTTGPGSPGNGTSFAWNGNSDGTGFGYIDFRQAFITPELEQTAELCGNSSDDDLDGATDCDDTECGTVCFPPPPPGLTEDACPLGSADLCCSDSTDNEGDGPKDCEDVDCQGTASMCTISWLKTKFGNVYAQKGIETVAPPGAEFNASYCLSFSEGSITGFASQAGCIATSSALALPSSGSSYKGSLGAIDVNGIQSGRYGPVVQIADGAALPDQLNGKVYAYTGGGTLVVPAKTFQNGIGATGRGNGLLFVRGADVQIVGNLTYASPSVDNYLRNLASFGIIAVKDSSGLGGKIIIDPTVQNVVGALFAEESISTGVSATPFQAYGMMASRVLYFERTGGTSSTAAETISFDGRAVANPPPGMQDVGKSLPTAKDAF